MTAASFCFKCTRRVQWSPRLTSICVECHSSLDEQGREALPQEIWLWEHSKVFLEKWPTPQAFEERMNLDFPTLVSILDSKEERVTKRYLVDAYLEHESEADMLAMTRELLAMTREQLEVLEALEGLGSGGCFCPAGFGGRVGAEHIDRCAQARAAIRRLTSRRRRSPSHSIPESGNVSSKNEISASSIFATNPSIAT